MVSLRAPLSDCGSLCGNDRSRPVFSSIGTQPSRGVRTSQPKPIPITPPTQHPSLDRRVHSLRLRSCGFRSIASSILGLTQPLRSCERAKAPPVHVQRVSVSCTSGSLHLRSPRESVDLPLGRGLCTCSP